MKLSPTKFNRFLGHIGQRLEWRRAADCPCINPHSGAARHDCQYCGGKGQTWADAVAGTAAPAGHKVQREWAQFGVWESGDLVVTIPESSPLYAMGQFDRVTMLDASDRFDLTLTRGQNDVLYFQVVAVDRVWWLDSSDDVVEGTLPTVAPDGSMTWEEGEDGDGNPVPPVEPPAGTVYSISGTKRSEFFCWGMFPSNRNMHSGARLPKRVVLRKWNLFGR